MLDAGTTCGEDFVNPTTGTNDGWSLVGGALYAGTITDPFRHRPGSITDPSGGEIGDKCAGIPAVDLTAFHLLPPRPSPCRTLWSNAAGGCVQTGAVKDSIKITSPGNQTSNVGATVNLPIVGISSAGNPLAWSETGLPAGLTINASTGTVTGTPTTPGTPASP